MSQVFAAFGIDWRLLIINAVNFGLLLLALWYFLYQPLTNMLESRRQKVAQGVRDSEEAGRELREIEASRQELLAAAGREADLVLAQTRAAAADKEKELVAQSERVAASIVKDAEVAAQELQRQAVEGSKQEVAKLIVLGMEKMLQEKNA